MTKKYLLIIEKISLAIESDVAKDLSIAEKIIDDFAAIPFKEIATKDIEKYTKVAKDIFDKYLPLLIENKFRTALNLILEIAKNCNFYLNSQLIVKNALNYLSSNPYATLNKISEILHDLNECKLSRIHFSKKESKELKNIVFSFVDKKLSLAAGGEILSQYSCKNIIHSLVHLKNLGLLDGEKDQGRLDESFKKLLKNIEVVNFADFLSDADFRSLLEIGAYLEKVLKFTSLDGATASSSSIAKIAEGKKLKNNSEQSKVEKKIFQNLIYFVANGQMSAKDDRDWKVKAERIACDKEYNMGRYIFIPQFQYCQIAGQFLRNADIAVFDTKEKKIVLIIEVDGPNHQAFVDGQLLQSGKTYARNQLLKAIFGFEALIIPKNDFTIFDEEGKVKASWYFSFINAVNNLRAAIAKGDEEAHYEAAQVMVGGRMLDIEAPLKEVEIEVKKELPQKPMAAESLKSAKAPNKIKKQEKKPPKLTLTPLEIVGRQIMDFIQNKNSDFYELDALLQQLTKICKKQTNIVKIRTINDFDYTVDEREINFLVHAANYENLEVLFTLIRYSGQDSAAALYETVHRKGFDKGSLIRKAIVKTVDQLLEREYDHEVTRHKKEKLRQVEKFVEESFVQDDLVQKIFKICDENWLQYFEKALEKSDHKVLDYILLSPIYKEAIRILYLEPYLTRIAISCIEDDEILFKILCFTGLDFNQKINGDLLICIAARAGSKYVEYLLMFKENLDINLPGKYGTNAIEEAIFKGNLESVKLLHQAGAVSIDEVSGLDLIAKACSSPSQKIVQYLLSCQADLKAAANKVYHLKEVSIKAYTTPLAIASYNDNDATVQYLIDIGANIEWQNENGLTAVFSAVAAGAINALKILCLNGANVNHIMAKGLNLLNYATTFNKNLEQIVEVICLYNVNANNIDTNGATPIINVLANQEIAIDTKVKILEILIKNGADISLGIKEGKTALDIVHSMPDEQKEKVLSVIMKKQLGGVAVVQANKLDDSKCADKHL